ncbi:MAG: hypothetical protein CVV23_01825 [Ignavibacteriae bacterium HGW-Ignavibacteriae-2]|jgi:UPF0176 protein|nr:MAG: hypothetical protein CVV23_01825 [Ignavibacteriae bacterium HGW-Ignavibacteriae-2]
MNYTILLFYKYIKIDDPHKFQQEHLNFCLENNIRGRVFVSEEGINATVSGTKENIEKYKNELRRYPEFEDIWFKEDESLEHAFNKTHVRVKKEIVHSGLQDVSLANGGKRLNPGELKKFYEDNEDFVIIDARNTYESVIGKFKNAITPRLDTFRDWTKVAEEYKEFKDKKVVTYCTGGIRCEKASAYLIENGFKNVYQLDGGIVTYTKQFPDTFWEGSVFVFDERRIVEPNKKEELKHIGQCYYCGTKTSWYINCHNQNCDKLLVTCHKCKEENDYCCSDECRSSDNKRSRYHG